MLYLFVACEENKTEFRHLLCLSGPSRINFVGGGVLRIRGLWPLEVCCGRKTTGDMRVLDSGEEGEGSARKRKRDDGDVRLE